MKTITLLIALLLLPWTPWAEKEPGWIVDAHTQPIDCPKVFRIEKCDVYIDSIWTQKYPYSSFAKMTCDTMPEFHWEHYIRYSLCTTLVTGDTTVYVGE